MMDSIIYQSKNYILRKLKNPFIIGLLLLLIYINWLPGIFGILIWLSMISIGNKQFIINNEAFIDHRPNSIFKLKEVYKWSKISEIQINYRGFEGYGGSPYLDIIFKTGGSKRISYDALEEADFDQFTKAIQKCIGEDGLKGIKI